VKVSVVVPMYNSGTFLDTLVSSLDGQTMPAHDFEVILVDDGSTDNTLARARELAATRPNLVVESIPNSGWPGRPRNVGLDRARGEYVFFADHDDRFGARALEKTHAAAVAAHADIVYGKVVRVGRRTSHWAVWRADVAEADPAGAPMQSRTVHKLYRKSFLDAHRIRFREGRVRLEDHEFMSRALAHAGVISIVASEPIYYWIHRSDGSNASDDPVDPAAYWSDYRRALESFAAAAGPGKRLDAARVTAAAQALTRLSPAKWRSRTPAERRLDFDAIRPLFREQVPATLDSQLSVLKRLRAQAIRAGDFSRFEQLQANPFGVRLSMRTKSLSWRAEHLHVRVSGTCRHQDTDEIVSPVESDGHIVLPVDDALLASDADRRLNDADLGSLELSIRHRESGVEWPIHSQTSRRGPGLKVVTDAVIDTTADTFGSPLTAGTWDVVARLSLLGDNQLGNLAVPARLHESAEVPASVFPGGARTLCFTVAGSAAAG
jgi:hypothetical protein